MIGIDPVQVRRAIDRRDREARGEREHVVEVVIEQNAGRVPVVPQTGATSTREAIELSQHAEKHGAEAIMVVAPYYEPFSIAEVKRYYADVAGSVSIPVMAKARIGHFVEAQVLQSLGVDYLDESEVLTPAELSMASVLSLTPFCAASMRPRWVAPRLAPSPITRARISAPVTRIGSLARSPT